MRYLVDSDWIADYLKGRPAAVDLVDFLFPDGIAISIISFAEVFEGVYYGHDRPRYEASFRHFLHGVTVLSITRPVARRFAIVRGSLRMQGRLISQTDLLIAATALHHNLTMVTRNVRDFGRIPGLELY